MKKIILCLITVTLLIASPAAAQKIVTTYPQMTYLHTFLIKAAKSGLTIPRPTNQGQAIVVEPKKEEKVTSPGLKKENP